MSLVRLLGFKTLGCGCLAGHYRELATSREIAYIEEKGSACAVHGHRRNHTVMPERTARVAVSATHRSRLIGPSPRVGAASTAADTV